MANKKYNNITYLLKKYETLGGNYTQVSNDIYKITNSNEFKIYSYLCMRYNKDYHYSFPSIRTISKDCNISTPTVNKCIKHLEEIGLIKIIKFEEKTTQYTNNVYLIYYPIIVKNELEEKEEELEKQKINEAIKEADKDILNKIRTIGLENDDNNSDNNE